MQIIQNTVLTALLCALLAGLNGEPKGNSNSDSLLSAVWIPDFAQDLDFWAYPVIDSLERAEGVFAQFLREVQQNNRRWAQRRALLPLSLYLYQVRKADTIFTISAKAGLSPESIATLNRIAHPNNLPLPNYYIMLPNNSGIFLPKDESQNGLEQQPHQGLSAWENQLRENRTELLFHRLVVGKRVYFYYPKSRFTTKERRYFLSRSFRSPVQQKFTITSPFGSRSDPISGKQSFHDGIDIRSPYGAPVYSIANATVIEAGQSPLYGLFVRIKLHHRKEQEAIYGHLIAVLVREGQRVSAGEAIGNSGNSGRSTGPHLHLSIFEQGRAVDPAKLLRNVY